MCLKEIVYWRNDISFKKDIENGHVLQIAKAHFRYTIWFLVSEKNVSWDFFAVELVYDKVWTRHTKTLCTKMSNSFNS